MSWTSHNFREHEFLNMMKDGICLASTLLRYGIKYVDLGCVKVTEL